MASVSVSHLIIFIAAMLVAASVAGMLTNTVNDISNAIEEQGFSTSDDIRSDITIINDPGNGTYDSTSNEVTLYVKNTGRTELATNSGNIDLFVNGVFTPVSGDNVTILEGAEIWGRNDVVRMTVSSDNVNDPGENRVKVVADGAEDVFVWEE